MKKSLFIFLSVASFVGVLAALQVDHMLGRRQQSDSPNIFRGFGTTPVSFDTNPGGPVDFRAAAKRVLPCVVSVDRYERIQRFFTDEATVQETGTGSGVIISTDGTIVTNNHVVADASEVRVRLADHRTFTAEVVGRDERSDLAVLKIKTDGLSPIELGDSDKLEVGQWVLAVGNPLGYDQTVSAGVVSNKARSLPSEGSGILINAIQTDAAINPGNSGGALTDASGRLVGINSAIISNTGTSIGIGFAIPVNRVKRVVQDILQTGRARNPILGLSFDPRLEGLLESEDGRRQMAEATGSTDVPSTGLIVPPNGRRDGAVPEFGPASAAGIQPLDVILAIDGSPIKDRLGVFQALDGKKPGDKVRIKLWSKGTTKTVVLTLGEEPAQS